MIDTLLYFVRPGMYGFFYTLVKRYTKRGEDMLIASEYMKVKTTSSESYLSINMYPLRLLRPRISRLLFYISNKVILNRYITSRIN